MVDRHCVTPHLLLFEKSNLHQDAWTFAGKSTKRALSGSGESTKSRRSSPVEAFKAGNA
jgi:hypothetical protein